MDETMTISKVSAKFGLSTRTLRYWEEIGLIESERTADYAYRMYTEDTVRRIGQIVILRRLRIPLAEIAEWLNAPTARKLLEVLQATIVRTDDEIEALKTLRGALTKLANQASWSAHLPQSDEMLMELLSHAAPPANSKEETGMNELKRPKGR